MSYILQDHLGSTSGAADSAGTLTSTISYFSFGAVRSSTGTSPTDKKFTGQILDNTGLYYYNARYYDPGIGRFISADTIVPNPANPQSLNRYSYCLNNPLKYIDKQGHFAILAALAVGAAIGAIVNGTIYAVANRNDFSWRDFGVAAGTGALTGALSVVGGPVAGTACKAVGIGIKAATAAKYGGSGINAIGGGVVELVSQKLRATNGESSGTDWGEVAKTTILSGLLSLGSAIFLPTKGMDTLKQSEYFSPRTARAFYRSDSPNASNIMAGVLGENIVGGIAGSYFTFDSAYILDTPMDYDGTFNIYGVTEQGSIIMSTNDPSTYDPSEWY